jgi:hypothetical protein
MKSLKLRGHHINALGAAFYTIDDFGMKIWEFMYTDYFSMLGYSEDCTARIVDFIKSVKEKPKAKFTIVSGLDDICAKCSNHSLICTDALDDAAFLEAAGLELNKTYRIKDIYDIFGQTAFAMY